jgi:GTP cyclohydrolase I
MTSEEHFQAWLDSLGFAGDPEMASTAERVTAFFRDFVPAEAPPVISTCAATGTDPIVLRELPFWSLCAHHFLPFHGRVSIAWRPAETLIGLGALPTLVAHAARKPQLQERMTAEIADLLWTAARPTSLVVRTVARHLCVEMRHPAGTPEVEVLARRGDLDLELQALLTR